MRINKRQRDLLLFVFLFLVCACDKLPIKSPLLLPGFSNSSSTVNKNLNQSVTSAEPLMQFKTDTDRQRFYSWIAREMVQQVFLQEPKSNGEVASWANVLLQGGSIEGIYHGLVLSNDYSNLERGTASVKAVRFFASETVALKDLSLDQKEFESRSSRLVQENINASLFSLKRQMGEQVLQEINVRKKDKVAFADWYAKIVLRWNDQGISFGLAERNKADFDFHKNWALNHPMELVEWELLNRVHRIFNQLSGISLGGK